MRLTTIINKRTLLTYITLVAIGIKTYAQNIPNNSVQPVASPVTLPNNYSKTLINYIRTWEPNLPISDPAIIAGNPDINAVKQTTVYYDGLGRIIQKITRGNSGTGMDMVMPTVYDAYGREAYSYLPYAAPSQDGKFRPNAFVEQKQFLSSQFSGEDIYYSRVQYELSPMDRVSKSMFPGNSWAGSERGTSQQYLLNTADDEVRIWTISTGVIPESPAGKIYQAGQLYKNITTDERGYPVMEFKDKEGRLILRKTSLTTSPGNGHDNWLCTYHIYDEKNNQRFILTPKAVRLIKNTWVISQQVADELCFQYQYDARNRVISNKTPGTLWPTEIVYDKRDRQVFQRDGNLKEKQQWIVTFYDELNRQVETALYTSSNSREQLQTQMDLAVNTTQTILYNEPGPVDLSLSSYDNQTHLYQASNSITFLDGFETSTDAEVTAEINPTVTTGQISLSVSNPLPSLDVSQLYPLTYTFYDNYTFNGVQSAVQSEFNKLSTGSNNYAEPTIISPAVTGQITGSKVRVLYTNQWLTTTNYFDEKARTIQSISDNSSGGKDFISYKYDFSGKKLSFYQHHSNPKSTATPETRILTVMNYDAFGRVKEILKQHNDNNFTKKIISNEYNELGQLKTRTLGDNLESISFDYNIRG